MFKKKTLTLIFSFILMFSCGFQVLAWDFETDSGLQNTGKGAGYEDAGLTDVPLEQIIGKVINTILVFIGVFFMILMIYGGFIWMFSRGNDQEVQKAKAIIINSIIGLIVVLSAYAITYFVLSIFSKIKHVP